MSLSALKHKPRHAPSSLALHIDYLTVAEAALACGRPMTAMLHTELWCVNRHGEPVMASSKAPLFHTHLGSGDSVPRQQRILFAAMSQASDSDGMMAVRDGSNLHMLAQAAFHGHNWVDSMQAADAALRSGSVGAPSLLGGGGGEGLGTLRLQVAASLRNMGLLDVMTHYLTSSAIDVQQNPRLCDIEFEVCLCVCLCAYGCGCVCMCLCMCVYLYMCVCLCMCVCPWEVLSRGVEVPFMIPLELCT